MEKLIEKTNELIDAIDKCPTVLEIKELNKELENNKELLNLIEDYKNTKNESIKEKIISNDFFRKYKEKETDINILIMSINQKLKKISNERSCNK
jgi:cell fate (sporulation/competence/biofilm development) regulator YlbF (YheA/YmcA/DUF963 family)